MRPAIAILLTVLVGGIAGAAEWRPTQTVSIEEYPPLARQAWISGDVEVRCVVSDSGVVTKASAVSGHPLLAVAAAENAKKWRFQLAGPPPGERSEITLVYSFRLTEPGTPATPSTTFNVLPPNRVVITAPLACHENIPCTLQKPLALQEVGTFTEPFKFSKEDSIQSASYLIEKSYDEVEQGWTARISRGGKLLGVFSIGREGTFEKHQISFGLFPLLKTENREQLVVRIWSGGAHCCDTIWVADLNPEFRLLYKSATYSLNVMIGAADLDGDGNAELWQENRTFDYFCGSFADSPDVRAYFRYDSKIGRYVPANNRFAEHALHDAALSSVRLRDINTRERITFDELPENVSPGRYCQLVLNMALPMIYAGHADAGWAFFDHEYRLPDRTALKSRVKSLLKHDPFYHALPR